MQVNASQLIFQTALYEAGTDTLEREFRNLLHRHSKPVPAVAMLDIMTIDEGMCDLLP